MPIPLSTEKVARAVLKTLVRSNLLGPGDDALLSAIPANATDAYIDTVVNSLHYGTISGTGTGGVNYVSDTDINMWVDADNLPTTMHQNYFRVARNGYTETNLTPSASAVARELMTVGRHTSGPTYQTGTVEMTIGPRADIVGAGATTYAAQLMIGAWHDGGAARHYGFLWGSPTSVHGTDPGLTIEGRPALELYAANLIGVRGAYAGALRGGFNTPTSTASFFVGDPTSVATNAVWLSDVNNGDFELKLNRSSTGHVLYLNSNETAQYSTHVAVGGWTGVATRTPASADINWPTLAVFGPDAGSYTPALFQAPQAAGYTGVVVRILANDTTGPYTYNLLTCEQWTGAAYVRRFRVSNVGHCYCSGAFTGGGADVAEWMDTAEQYEPGGAGW
jgi:hypothetical protein